MEITNPGLQTAMSHNDVRNAGIDSRAQIDAEVRIGPYCVIGPDVRISRGTRLENHVTLSGRVTIGEDNHLHPGVMIGNRRFGCATIGDHNTIRESVTITPGRGAKGHVTIGNGNLLMACVHIAAGCRLGDQITIANATRLGRLAQVQSCAFLSGGVVVGPKVVIGRHAFLSIQSHVQVNVPPFLMIEGRPPRARCVNVVGLKRFAFSVEEIRALTQAYRLLYRLNFDLTHAWAALEKAGLALEPVRELFDFIIQFPVPRCPSDQPTASADDE
jgi:UDP-N-acetylglucosamine acyltransferase